jgi:hypothetical protein
MLVNVLSYIIIAFVIFLFIWAFRYLAILGQARERKQYTYEQLAEDYDLWNKYVNDVDLDNKDMPRTEHSKLSTEEKIQILTTRFGKEKRK